MKKTFLITLLISAFLLFQIQPLIGKIALPFFGGNAAIWTTCMFFFQTFLFAGYYYSHRISQRSISKQVFTHTGLALISLAFLPLTVNMIELGISTTTPLFNILATLFMAIGMPYFLLATSVPLLQKWFALLQDEKASDNYYFYAFSNGGALAGLLTYPFIFEPYLSIQHQSLLWTGGFIAYLALLFYAAYSVYRTHGNESPLFAPHKVITKQEDTLKDERKNSAAVNCTGLKQQLYWIGLSTTGVILLLSITNAATQNIPPVPFLWILPLSIYLLTHILSFSRYAFYQRWIMGVFFLVSASAALMLYHSSALFDIYSQLVIYGMTLATGCMICHGELARSKPEESQQTRFYLSMSLGGFLGGLFVSVIAPLVFTEYLEFPIGILLVMVLFLIAIGRQRKLVAALWTSCAVIIGLAFVYVDNAYKQRDVDTSRSFYGTLSVKDVHINGEKERRLIDGMTSHGAQRLAPDKALSPIAYYSPDTGMGLLLTTWKGFNNPMNLGVIGLGTGTLAAYGDKHDGITFYELNPDVERFARLYFTYLDNTQSRVKVVLGDGRMSLSKRPQSAPKFDILAVDAFSSDAIPKHLLTLEAFQLYWQHVSPNGALALHISNNHLDLLPVVKSAAQQLGMQLLYFSKFERSALGTSAQWVVMTNNTRLLNHPVLVAHADEMKVENAQALLWTDDFSALMHVIK